MPLLIPRRGESRFLIPSEDRGGSGLPQWLIGKEHAGNVAATGDTGLIPGSERSPGGGPGNPLQYSCLENPHEQTSLVGYSPLGHKESDITEANWHACPQSWVKVSG